MKSNLVAAGAVLAATLASASWAQAPADSTLGASQTASPMAHLAIGTVKSIDAAGRSITIDHQAIANLGMPAMTMQFRVSPASRLILKPGLSIAFTFTASVDGLTIGAAQPIQVARNAVPERPSAESSMPTMERPGIRRHGRYGRYGRYGGLVPGHAGRKAVSERLNRPAWLANFGGRPDRAAALARYARLAPRYEDTTTRIRQVRERALDLPALQPGETVFGIAFGAGAILRGLSSRVGPRGRGFGVEQSPEMAARAIEASGGCNNERVLCEPVETFRSPPSGDAAVLCYTHDVLQSPQALANLFAHLPPGARVNVAELCLLPAWRTPVNAWMLSGARRDLTTWRGLRAPWVPSLDWCPDLRLIERYHCGTGYLTVGTVRSR